MALQTPLQISERPAHFPKPAIGRNPFLGLLSSPTSTSPQDLSWQLPEEVAAHNITRSKAHHLLLKIGHYETQLFYERESSRALTLSLQSMQKQIATANDKRARAEEALRNCPCTFKNLQVGNIGIAIESDVTKRTPFFPDCPDPSSTDSIPPAEQDRQLTKRKRGDEDNMSSKRLKIGLCEDS